MEVKQILASALALMNERGVEYGSGSGAVDEPDHWRDVAGYAELVVRDLRRREIARQADQVLAQP